MPWLFYQAHPHSKDGLPIFNIAIIIINLKVCALIYQPKNSSVGLKSSDTLLIKIHILDNIKESIKRKHLTL